MPGRRASISVAASRSAKPVAWVKQPSTTDYCYDPNGNLTGVWDALHPKATFPTLPSTSYEYDILDRLTAVRQPWVPGGANEKASTEYKYDVQDHLREVKDAEGNITQYTTSDRDLMTKQDSPVSGITNYTYNPHGALLTTADARGITVTRQVDDLDRVLLEDYPDPRLDTQYLYDTNVTPGTDFFTGRLKSIARNGETIAYTYDRFGRMLQDGDLTNFYDKNGRKTQINYPNGVQANFTAFDVADRPLSMTVSGGGLAGTTTVVSGATYKPGGPLTTLTLGNGLTENRFFDARYFPDRIQVPGKIDWDYTVDAAGNVTQIADGSTPRVYGYRDYQYFLTSGSGPWTGPLAWTYDKIGNRLTEARGAVTDTYSYVINGTGGRNPKLSTIAQSGGTKTFAYDAIGDEARVFGPSAEEERIFDDAGRLTRWVERTKNEGTTFRYDGRGFLRESKQDLAACNPLATTATYSSAGLLMHRKQTHGITAATNAEDYVLYFAGRPVAQLTSSPGPSKLTWLTTDHLGTPILATLASPGQTTTFVGGLEPFGRDFAAPSAQSVGVFLRFPGQWDDGSWSGVSGGGHYNVNRWYESGIGRYERADPLSRYGELGQPLYAYALSSPIRLVDPRGLFAIDASCTARCSNGGLMSSNFAAGLRAASRNCAYFSQAITDVGLRACTESGCRFGRVECADPDKLCGPLGAGAFASGSTPGAVTLCPGNFPNIHPHTLGLMMVHEFAHTCDWRHGDGKGVPLDPGLDFLPRGPGRRP